MTEFIDKPRKNMDEVFDVPEKASLICAIRTTLYKRNPNIKMVTIGLHGGRSVSHWAGVYGFFTPDKDEFINPFSVFTFGGQATPGSIKRLSNFRYVNQDEDGKDISD